MPLLETGVLASTCDLFLWFWQWKHWKKPAHAWPIIIIGHNTCPMVAFSGILESPKPPPLGNLRGNVPAHHHGHQFGHLFRVICWLLFVFVLPWRPLGRYGASSHPMPASRGIWCGPGFAELGNAMCIASIRPHGHQNGLRRRCSFVASLILLSTITIANNHVMVHWN